MKAVVFLGPSLPVCEARRILPAVYLPPVAQSELLSAVTRYHPDVIGLIDGVFSQSLSVWHKEILFALEQGIAVYGASSMGALRALETQAFGMVGVGEVFGMYASGEITDDDEVALSHGPAESGYRQMSEPMVNLRATLALARDRGVVSGEVHDVLVAAAKRTFYPGRSFADLFEQAPDLGVEAAVVDDLRDFVAHHYVDLKRQDAVTLLETLRDRPEGAGQAPQFTLTRSHLFLAQYERDRMVHDDDVELPMATVASHAALHLPDFADVSSAGLDRELVGVLAEVLDVVVDEADVDAEQERFAFVRHLDGDEDLAAWAERNDLSPDELRDLLRSRATSRKMQHWLITRKYLQRTTKTVLDELRLRGRYETVKREAATVERVLRAQYPDFESFDYSDLTVPDLVTDHLNETACRMDTDHATWAEEAGFKDLYDLRYELLRARLVRRRLAELAAQTAALLGPPSTGAEATEAAEHAGR